MVQKGKHYSTRAIEKARSAVAEDKTTFAGLRKRLERDFHIRPALSTSYGWFHEAADAIDLERDYEPWAISTFSGVLAVDELYDGVVVLVATDPLTGKTISIDLCDKPTERNMRAFLERLKDAGVEPKVIITDAAPLYHSLPKKVWPQVEHQLCLFHYTRMLTRGVVEALRVVRRDWQLLGRLYAKELWHARYLFTTRQEHLSPTSQVRLEKLCSQNDVVRAIRHFMENCYRMFDLSQSREDALLQRAKLLRDLPKRCQAPLKQAIHALRPERFGRAITFLSYSNCPRTSNSVERQNRWYRKRAKSHYRNRTRRAIWNMVKSDLMVRKHTRRTEFHSLSLR